MDLLCYLYSCELQSIAVCNSVCGAWTNSSSALSSVNKMAIQSQPILSQPSRRSCIYRP